MVIVGCAQVKPPTGGQKDTQPPTIVSAEPAPFSTNVQTETVEIVYDEYVRLSGVRDQLLISPPMEEAPEVLLKGARKLVMTFKEPLKDNTTYTINFGQAISDNNEGNVLEENVFLFSTGSYIDSLQISGLITQAKTDLPCASCLAMLHVSMEDSAIFSQKPYYISRTDEMGRFVLPHLKEGEYRLYGLEDTDGDLKYDRGEQVAAWGEPISLPLVDSVGFALRSYVEAPVEQYLKAAVPDKQRQSITMTFALPLDTFIYEPVGESPRPQTVLTYDRPDSLRMWFSPLTSDEPISLVIYDGELLLDTVEIRTDRRSLELDSIKVEKPVLAHDSTTMRIDLSAPLSAVDSSKILLLADSMPVAFGASLSRPDRILLSAEWMQGTRYSLTFAPGALTQVVGPTNDSLVFDVNCPVTDRLSDVSISVTDSSTVRRILILSSAGKKLATRTEYRLEVPLAGGVVTQRRIPPGSYGLKMLYDANDNGRWDTGELLSGRRPELIESHREELNLKPGWELEIAFDP